MRDRVVKAHLWMKQMAMCVCARCDQHSQKGQARATDLENVNALRKAHALIVELQQRLVTEVGQKDEVIRSVKAHSVEVQKRAEELQRRVDEDIRQMESKCVALLTQRLGDMGAQFINSELVLKRSSRVLVSALTSPTEAPATSTMATGSSSSMTPSFGSNTGAAHSGLLSAQAYLAGAATPLVSEVDKAATVSEQHAAIVEVSQVQFMESTQNIPEVQVAERQEEVLQVAQGRVEQTTYGTGRRDVERHPAEVCSHSIEQVDDAPAPQVLERKEEMLQVVREHMPGATLSIDHGGDTSHTMTCSVCRYIDVAYRGDDYSDADCPYCHTWLALRRTVPATVPRAAAPMRPPIVSPTVDIPLGANVDDEKLPSWADMEKEDSAGNDEQLPSWADMELELFGPVEAGSEP